MSLADGKSIQIVLERVDLASYGFDSNGDKLTLEAETNSHGGASKMEEQEYLEVSPRKGLKGYYTFHITYTILYRLFVEISWKF